MTWPQYRRRINEGGWLKYLCISENLYSYPLCLLKWSKLSFGSSKALSNLRLYRDSLRDNFWRDRSCMKACPLLANLFSVKLIWYILFISFLMWWPPWWKYNDDVKSWCDITVLLLIISWHSLFVFIRYCSRDLRVSDGSLFVVDR